MSELIEERFKRAGYTPLDLDEYENENSMVNCKNDSGLFFLTNLSALEKGNKPHCVRGNPFAMVNIRKIAARNGIEVPKDAQYEGKIHSSVIGYKDGLKVVIHISSLLRGSIPSPFHNQNPYALDNIQTICLGLGVKVSRDQEYRGARYLYEGTTEEGYRVTFRIHDVIDGKRPNPFHISNPYAIDNIQKLCDSLGNGCKVIPDQEYNGTAKGVLAVDEEGYKVSLTVDNLKAGKKASPFHISNPYTLENIDLFCAKNDLPYKLVPGQNYKGAKDKLVFRSPRGDDSNTDEKVMAWDYVKKRTLLKQK